MSKLSGASVVVPGFSPTDRGAPRICARIDAPPIPVPGDGPASTFELFQQGLGFGRDRDALGYRPLGSDLVATARYKWLSFGDVDDAVRGLAAALTSQFALSPGDPVGISGKSCPNWTVVSLAVAAAGLQLVPLYDTLGPDAISYICEHAELQVVFVADEVVEKFLESRPKTPSVRHVVVFGSEGFSTLAKLKPELVSRLDPADNVHKLGDVISSAPPADSRDPLAPGDLDAVFVIMYTSGTTGKPKGVMLKNSSLMWSCRSGNAFLSYYDRKCTQRDTLFSFLPLAHIFAQQIEAQVYSQGARIGYYQGDIKLLLSDLTELAPTIFIGVPRVYARFEQKIREAGNSGSFFKRALFNYAISRQMYCVRNNLPRIKLWDVLVCNKVRAKLLPNAVVLVTGAAPMSADTNDFLSAALNCPLMQGFGMTETLGGVTCQPPHGGGAGTSGPPLPGEQIKLVDVPEMGYLTSDLPNPRGEVYVKSPSNMVGYYKSKEETAKAFPDGDEWLATGDIGKWDDNGYLCIIDRRKNLFKLAQGEYVSPELLENEYAKADLILQIWVYGSSLESSLVAVVVPDAEPAAKWASANNMRREASLQEIGSAPKFKESVLEQLSVIRVAVGFKGYEQIRDVKIETSDLNELGQGFHAANGLSTPTFKWKRPLLLERYRADIDAMYAGMKST